MIEKEANAYLIGGGIASLSAAVLLIRDAGWSGDRIHLYESSSVLGGSLDGSGNAHSGYLIRGGRMFEPHFECTFDLLRSIPCIDAPGVSVTDEIKAFTEQVVPSSNCRLVVEGERMESPSFQLSTRDKWDLIRLTLRAERSLESLTIEQYFSPHFLESHFWIMWCTMFAFQPWHSVAEFRRYMRRFMHLLPGFNRLEGICRTRLNQYDSIVQPVVAYLQKQGVHFHMRCRVENIEFSADGRTVARIPYRVGAKTEIVTVTAHDRVFITLGSMTDASSVGTMTEPPILQSDASAADSWKLWRNIVRLPVACGDPELFAGDIEKTLWESFTVTQRDSKFFDHMKTFTGNEAGTGGLVTFRDSGWLMSVVLARQPHFIDQPEDVYVFWGYGLRPERQGDFIRKPMLECSGDEILQELSYQLRLGDDGTDIFSGANCIPCLMPYITSQFMPRSSGSRPQVRPDNAENYAFLGQFCELPDDTVFTVEYSVRSAQTAVFSLCDTDRQVIPLFRGFEKPKVVARAMRALLMNGI